MASKVVHSNGPSEESSGEIVRSRSSSLPAGNGPLDDGSPQRELTFGRVKRKAKRFVKPSHFDNISGNNSLGNSGHLRYNKNSRRSRNGYGRGLPKKGGAGGKGTWGIPGSELLADDVEPDIHDPNYDPENQDNFELEATAPEISPNDFEKTVEPLILEYFEHGETQEVIFILQELNFGELRPSIVNLIISIAMERKPSQCELSSVLLSDMYGSILNQEDMTMGFDQVLACLEDISLDTPDAATILGNFIARAVADDCLPPKYVQDHKETMECPRARAAIEHAAVLLSMKHGMVRLDNVWGVGGGLRPVKSLINKMQLLLKEYLCSGDAAEACRCLQELEVPHFHHEIVYEAAIMAIENMRDRTMELICSLLKLFARSIIVTPDQMVRGFKRVYDDMPDICIDVPPAYTVLEKFVSMCQKAGFLPDEIVKSLPSRGRKRFVSEGDGGIVKNSDEP